MGLSSSLNQRGQSLVQILISIAIMGIMLAAMASMQKAQSRENRALGEKLGSLDLQRSMSASLISGNVCTYMLTHPVATFNGTLVTGGTPQYVTLSTPFYASVTAGVPGAVLAQVGPANPPNPLPITSITLTVSSGSGNTFIGSIDVNFDQSQLVRSIKSASAGVVLTVDATNPAAAKVQSCAGTGGSGGGAVSTSEDGVAIMATGSGAKLTTPYITMNHGIFYVDFYDCVVGAYYGSSDSVDAEYFQHASAEASSGSIASGFWNSHFRNNPIYNGHAFILKILSPTANVRFFFEMGNGGNMTYGTFPCSGFYYYKITN